MSDYIFLGDSLTFGYGVKPKDNWVNLLQNHLKINILNKGINGNTTTDMLFRFYEDVIINNPKVLFIMGGTNDLLSNRSVDSIISNIEVMIKEALNKNVEIIIGIPPEIIPTMAENLFMPSLTYKYCHKNLSILKEKLINLCAVYKLQYIDFYNTTKNSIDKNIYLDGIHLNSIGQNLLFETAKEVFILN